MCVFGFVHWVHAAWAQPQMTSEQIKSFYKHKTKKFKLSRYNFSLADTSVIDTGSIYVLKIEEDSVYRYLIPELQQEPVYYTFLRFFKNGQVFKSGLYHSIPSNEEANDLVYGEHGYYIVKGDQIILEVFLLANKSFQNFYARSTANKILLYEYQTRGDFLGLSRVKLKQVYSKHKAKLYSQPNW